MNSFERGRARAAGRRAGMRRLASRTPWLIGAAIVGTLPSVASAQTAQTAVADNQEGALTDVVVTAERRSESLSRTPVTVTVVTPDLLIKKAVMSDQDLQAAVPGLTIRANATANQLSFSIRGQSIDAFSSSRPAVLTYLNEVQTTNNAPVPFYDLGSIQVLKGPQGTLFGRNVTGGAVLFTSAPPTATLGGNAMVRFGDYASKEVEGAINIPLSSDDLILRVAGDYQYHRGYGYNEYDGSNPGTTFRHGARVSLFERFAPNLTNTVVVDYSKSTGTNLAPPIYSIYPRGAINNGTALTSTAALFYTTALSGVVRVPPAFNIYLAAHPKAFPGGIVAYTALQQSRSPFDVNVDAPLGHFGESTVVTDTLAYQLSDLLTVKNILGLGWSRSKENVDLDGTPFGLQAAGPNGFDTRTRNRSEELQLQGKDAAGLLDYVVGFYYSHQRNLAFSEIYTLEVAPFIPTTITNYRTAQRTTTYAGYAQATYRFGDRVGVPGLSATAGVRYTSDINSLEQLPGGLFYNSPAGVNYEKVTTNKPSWQLGLQEQLDRNLLLYVVSRHSFRSGGYNGTAPPQPVDASRGGNYFNAETTTDVEVGAKFQGRVGGIPLRASVAAYSQWIDDVQRSIYVVVPATGTGSALTLNVPRARVQGVEVDNQLSLTPWLDIGGNVAFTKAKFTSNTATIFTTTARYGPYGDTPRWSGSAFAEISLPTPADVGRLSVRSDVYAQSSFYFSNLADTVTPQTKLRGYATVNFRLALDKVGGSRFSIAGLVRNAFDRTYYVGGLASGSTLGVNLAVPGAPRTFFVEGSVKF